MNKEHFFADKNINDFNPFWANNQELFDMSLKFANGDGVDIDFVAAHVCLNIATMRGCKDSAAYRKELAFDMKPDEISKAQKEARTLIQIIQKRIEN
jgi:hypothetical protein